MSHIDNVLVEKRLHERHDAILNRRRRAVAMTEELDDRDIEPGDNATDAADADRLAVLSDVDQRTLDAVDGALERLAAGTYGACQRCGKAIEDKRLELLPEVALCASCAHLAESVRSPAE
jgi:DnaK suppressor protein